MKTSILASTILVLLSTSANAAIDKITVSGISTSQHNTKGTDYVYNSEHDMFGVMVNDKYIISKFKNSYYERSYAVAYNFNLFEANYGDFEFGADFALGLVSGYNRDQLKQAYFGNGIGLYSFTSLTAEYNITKNVSVGVTLGFLPYMYGVITTQHLTLSYKF